jgi:hypothetical protein
MWAARLCRSSAVIERSFAPQREQATCRFAPRAAGDVWPPWDSRTWASRISGDRNAEPHWGQIASDSSYSTYGTSPGRGSARKLLSSPPLAFPASRYRQRGRSQVVTTRNWAENSPAGQRTTTAPPGVENAPTHVAGLGGPPRVKL